MRLRQTIIRIFGFPGRRDSQDVERVHVLRCEVPSLKCQRRVTWTLSATARMVSGHLLFRREHETIRPDSRPLPALEYLISDDYLAICQRISLHSWYSTFTRTRNEAIIKRGLDHPQALQQTCSCSSCSEVVRCPECATDFQVRSKQLPDSQLSIRLTWWQDLGELKSPFQGDWVSFTERNCRQSPRKDGGVEIKKTFEGGHLVELNTERDTRSQEMSSVDIGQLLESLAGI